MLHRPNHRWGPLQLSLRVVRIFLAGTCILAATIGTIDAAAGQSRWRSNQPPQFIVSGLLTRDGNPDQKKLFHAVVLARTEDEATKQFAIAVRQNFPGFSINTTLATRVPVTSTCEIDT